MNYLRHLTDRTRKEPVKQRAKRLNNFNYNGELKKIWETQFKLKNRLKYLKKQQHFNLNSRSQQRMNVMVSLWLWFRITSPE